MTVPNTNAAKNEEFMRYYVGEFRRLNEELFNARSEIVSDFYGTIFDKNMECGRLICQPPTRVVSPTSYMVWREAKFNLDMDSDSAEAEHLDGLWGRLHEMIADERNKGALAAMAAAHADAKRRIIECQADVFAAVIECAGLLENERQFVQARRFADGVIAETEQKLKLIVNSYPHLTTLSKIS